MLIAVSPCRLALSRTAEAGMVARGVRFAFLSGVEPTTRLLMDYALFVRRELGVSHRAARLYSFDRERHEALARDGLEFRL